MDHTVQCEARRCRQPTAAGGADKQIVLRARADATVKSLKAQLAAKCGLAADELAHAP